VPSTDEQDYGPRVRGGRSPGWRTALFAGLAGLVALVIAASASAGLFLWADSKVDRVEVAGIQPVGEPGQIEGVEADPDLDLEEVVNVLVVGIDAREGFTDDAEDEDPEPAPDGIEGERTDTIMLVRLDPKQDAVSLLSFPRDLLVTRCDGSRGRINAAYQIGEQSGVGGPSCLVQTITDFSALPVHHYVAVDFPGFIELVDLVDGVTVYLEHPIDDWRAKLDLPAGCNRLDGETALGFVRHRASDSDYGRVARQQRFVKELLREATRLGNLMNVPRLLRMVETGAQAVQTDQDLSIDLMRRIAFTFRDLDGDNIAARTVPGDFQMIDGVAFEVPIEDQARALFAAFQAGTLQAELGQPDPAAEEPADGPGEGETGVEPADVPALTVLNGAGIPGLAAEARDQLEAAGFRVAAIDNADEFDRTTTEIRHPAELAAEAERLAVELPGAELVVDDGPGIVVVLGSDYEPGATEDEPDAPVDEADDEDEAPPAPPPAPDQQFVGAQPPPPHCYER
jgi:LCP family protein required for cell wall assembly